MNRASPRESRRHRRPERRPPLRSGRAAITARLKLCLPAAALLALAATVAPAIAQAPPQPSPNKAQPAKPQRTPEALPLYTSDGKMIGRVIAVGRDADDKPVLVAEIDRALGFGPTAIAVPLDLISGKADRIELTITEAEVNARLAR